MRPTLPQFELAARGAATVDPSRLQGYRRGLPPVVIEQVRANDQDVTGGERIELPAGTRKLDFQYAGLSFQMPRLLRYRHRLEGVDFDAHVARFVDDRDGRRIECTFSALVGADGAGSSLRAAMQAREDLGERTEFLDHSYKELEIPPSADGDFMMEPNALHIWPRGHYMCIALPNDERTFTVTLFLPNHGDPSFASVRTGKDAKALFLRDFADAVPLIPELEQDWETNPTGLLATLYLDRWHLGGQAVLLGDAAHAMVPFHGQGMNCAFEDCVALARHLLEQDSLAQAFAAFEAERKPDAAAIQRMALDNYLEMRDRVDDADYLLQRELELALQARHAGRFVPHYAMVTFMRIPYSLAMSRTDLQRGILERATAGHASLSTLDWDAIDAEVLDLLTPLEDVPA